MAEKVLLVTVDFKERNIWPAEDIAEELKNLVASSKGEVVESIICKCNVPTARFLIGEGKVEEIADLCLLYKADTVVFSRDLKGSQQRNLEEVFKVKTIDRTQLILDIFARRAKSMEGKLQIELAQLEYLLPRLAGKGVELSQLGGGIGTLGPGETKLETDRRKISDRITRLRRELKEVILSRKTKRKKRKEQKISSVSLVGYTNAGKSTLINHLTLAEQRTKDGLFTTLDTLSRQYVLPNHHQIVISDTVGFMYELPHHLIESFKATLEEVVEADLLLHVLDVSNQRFQSLSDAVFEVLTELKAHDKPVITVLNKIDKIEDKTWLKDLENNFENAVCISALTGEGIPRLVEKITEFLSPANSDIDARIPMNRMDLVNLIHKEGQVHSIKYDPTSIRICATVPIRLADKIRPFVS